MATAARRPPRPTSTVESIVAVDAPREFRLHPRDRLVAYTAEVGRRAAALHPHLRGGHPIQLTASEKAVSDPQWSPDGRRLAYVRDGEIWVVEPDGSRLHSGGRRSRAAGRAPRWSPDGRRLAFLSRRRGWSQIWVIDAPGPSSRPPGPDPKPPLAEVLTATGLDVDSFEWAPDGAASRSWPSASPTHPRRSQIAIVDVATGASRGRRRVRTAATTGARWLAGRVAAVRLR